MSREPFNARARTGAVGATTKGGKMTPNETLNQLSVSGSNSKGSESFAILFGFSPDGRDSILADVYMDYIGPTAHRVVFDVDLTRTLREVVE